jgi:hypothetical protein
VPGIDFQDTYAPVASIVSIRLLCAMAAMLDWEIHVVDVDSAFLNSEMPDDQPAYARQPKGYETKGSEHLVWRLLKALYGLKQAAYLWYAKLCSIFVSLGFTPCISDPCIFVRRTDRDTLIVSSHVDDLGLFCSSAAGTCRLKSEISKHVPIKDLSEVSKLLGIEIIRDRIARTISFSHRRYIDEKVRKFRLEGSKPVYTPMLDTARLSKLDSPVNDAQREQMTDRPFGSLVGSLLHPAIMTRPDIRLAVQRVSQFLSNPGRAHWNAAIRILQYLSTTRDLILTVGGIGSKQLIAYCDGVTLRIMHVPHPDMLSSSVAGVSLGPPRSRRPSHFRPLSPSTTPLHTSGARSSGCGSSSWRLDSRSRSRLLFSLTALLPSL